MSSIIKLKNTMSSGIKLKNTTSDTIKIKTTQTEEIKLKNTETDSIKLKNTQVDEIELKNTEPVIFVSTHESFDGGYEITPKVENQLFETKNKLMKEDLNVLPIPFHMVNNEKGQTVIIGG